MKSFTEFTLGEGNELEDRNKAIDIASVVKKKAEEYKSKATEDELSKIIAYFEKSKTFSLGKMDDMFGSQTVSTGFLKAAIAVVKDAVDSAGYGKKGSVSATQSQAQRIDSYLKQKHIGPIKR